MMKALIQPFLGRIEEAVKINSVFPRRLFRWFIVKQVLVAGGLFFGLYLLLLVWLHFRGWDSPEIISVAHEILSTTLALTFVLVIAMSFFMARSLVVPLGRLIDKTRRLRKFPFDSEEMSEAELAYDVPGEWYDLERALNKLGNDLRQKTIRLSREKTELRAIMAAVSEAVLAVDHDYHPLFFNSQFALLFGLGGREVASLAIHEVLRSPEVLEAYKRCLGEGQTVRVECDLSVEGRSSKHTFTVSVSPLRKKHNQEIYGAVGIFYDITELKRSDRIRIEFVGNVSHELRTPLTSIKGYLQILDHDIRAGSMAQVPEFLGILTNNVDRLILLVNDLLDLSSLESGRELLRGDVDVREVTEGVLRQINVRDHVVKIHYGAESLNGDFIRAEQVLRNLIQNAIRYVPKGKTIEIIWEPLDEHGTRLRVKDDGPGIPLEHQPRLFERFYRIDAARSREVGGTGIGLSIVKHIMQRHGGSVTLVSLPGKGAEFICDFPT